MTMMTPIVQNSYVEMARIVFSIFAYISDANKNIMVQDVRRFHALLDEAGWVASEDLRHGLLDLRARYSGFWSSYEDGKFSVDIGSIGQDLKKIRRDLGPDRNIHFLEELCRLVDLLDRNLQQAKLNPTEQMARKQARDDLLMMLETEIKKFPTSEEHDLGLEAALEQALGGTDVLTIAQPIPAVTRLSPGEARIWAPGKTKVRCVGVVTETHDTKTYIFAAETPTLFHYKPGQFVTLEVLVGATVLRRSYTISSSPSRPYTLSVTVKKVPMGWMSNWLFDNMAEGFECAVTGPAGKFTCVDSSAQNLLFLSAGSGITPTMSMLRWLADTASKADIVVINNVRTPNDIIFHQELLHLSTRFGERMRLAIVPTAFPPGSHWSGLVGKFNEALLRVFAPDFMERETFVCGPAGYMAAVRSLLVSLGLPPARYHEESFGGLAPAAQAQQRASRPSATPAVTGTRSASPPAESVARPAVKAASAAQIITPPKPLAASLSPAGATPAPLEIAKQMFASPVPSKAHLIVSPTLAPDAVKLQSPRTGQQPAPEPDLAPPPDKPREAKVSIQGSGIGFIARPDQTILEAAEAAGVTLEHSCRSGICGSCKMRKVSGKTRQDERAPLSQDFIGPDHVLTCVSMAVSDVTLS